MISGIAITRVALSHRMLMARTDATTVVGLANPETCMTQPTVRLAVLSLNATYHVSIVKKVLWLEITTDINCKQKG